MVRLHFLEVWKHFDDRRQTIDKSSIGLKHVKRVTKQWGFAPVAGYPRPTIKTVRRVVRPAKHEFNGIERKDAANVVDLSCLG